MKNLSPNKFYMGYVDQSQCDWWCLEIRVNVWEIVVCEHQVQLKAKSNVQFTKSFF